MSAAVLAARTRGGLLVRVIVLVLALSATATIVFLAALRVPERTPGPGWVRGVSLAAVRARGVVFVPGARAFLVDEGASTPLALLARSPHLGETIRYCPSSGWFEDPMHGAKFDGLGRYALGPATRGLDRLGVRVVEGIAWIDPSVVTMGPPRGTPTTEAAGAFCVRG